MFLRLITESQKNKIFNDFKINGVEDKLTKLNPNNGIICIESDSIKSFLETYTDKILNLVSQERVYILEFILSNQNKVKYYDQCSNINYKLIEGEVDLFSCYIHEFGGDSY